MADRALSELSSLFPKVQREKRVVSSLLDEVVQTDELPVARRQRLVTLAADLSRSVAELSKLYEEWHTFWDASKTSLWQRRIESFKSDHSNLQTSLDKHLRSIGNVYETDAELRENIFGNMAVSRNIQSDHAAFLRERANLSEAADSLDRITLQGKTTLESVVGQNRRLKVIRRGVLDIGNSLGVSSTLISMSFKRLGADKMVVYGCMILSVAFFVFFYWLWKLYLGFGTGSNK
eukprot:Lankesteria_metandrocarpae@DN4637_c0_g1_i1.p1